MSTGAPPHRSAEARAATLAERVWTGQGAGDRLLRTLLVPAEAAYHLASRAYHAAYTRGLAPSFSVAAPVVSVGNLTVGGTGKTPFARWLVARLLEAGRAPAVLHGGYGEDEPELHRRWHPEVQVLSERNRLRSAGVAISLGADVLVLDDGFQHRRVRRDLDIVLIGAEQPLRPARLLPRGPWREPPSAARRADLLVVTRRTADPARAEDVAAGLERVAPGVPVARIHLRSGGWRRSPAAARPAGAAPAPPAGATPPGECIAVAAIAGPAHFVANARQAGASVVGVLAFPDHHAYTEADAAAIAERAAGRAVVTTAKDAVKLERWAQELGLWVLEQEVVVEEGLDRIETALAAVLA